MAHYLFVYALFILVSSTNLIVGKKSTASHQKMPLQGFQWKNRVLLIFSESAQNQHYKQQVRLLDDNAGGLVERDLIILTVFPERVELRNSAEVLDFSADELRQFYKVNTSFTVVLIGKDGGEKKRTQTILNPQELFGIIDAMPMRRAEMEKGN